MGDLLLDSSLPFCCVILWAGWLARLQAVSLTAADIGGRREGAIRPDLKSFTLFWGLLASKKVRKVREKVRTT